MNDSCGARAGAGSLSRPLPAGAQVAPDHAANKLRAHADPELAIVVRFSFSTYPIAQASIAYYSNIGLSGTVTTTITVSAPPPPRPTASMLDQRAIRRSSGSLREWLRRHEVTVRWAPRNAIGEVASGSRATRQ